MTTLKAALTQAENFAKSGNEREMVWFMRGTIYDRQKKYDQAEEQFKRVLAEIRTTRPC